MRDFVKAYQFEQTGQFMAELVTENEAGAMRFRIADRYGVEVSVIAQYGEGDSSWAEAQKAFDALTPNTARVIALQMSDMIEEMRDKGKLD